MTRTGSDRFLAGLAGALAEAAAAPELEAALLALTALAQDTLGDPEAVLRPGALRGGERDYRVAGVFLITPDRRYNMLTANVGFPPEQRRLAIPIEWNHPGEVVRTGRALLLENTEEHPSFRQFLRTSRMGSSIYAPVRAGGAMVGQIVAAAQVRWTYGAADLTRLELLAALAGEVWAAQNGAAWLAADYPAPDLWRAEERS
jgi:signal transduction protein with GAF and PtsI domain